MDVTRSGSLWRLKASKRDAHSSWLRSVDVSPDGNLIVSGAHDRALKLWDAGVGAGPPIKPLTPKALTARRACGSDAQAPGGEAGRPQR